MLQLNTLAPIALTRAALPAMLARRRGHFLVISSMAGRSVIFFAFWSMSHGIKQ